LLLLLWPLAVKKKHPRLHQLQLLLRHLLPQLLLLRLLPLRLHQPWLLLLHPLLTLLAPLPPRLSTLLLTLPKLPHQSNRLFVDLKMPPSGGFFLEIF